MAIDYSLLAFGKGIPRVIQKATKRREDDQALKDAYTLVDARDKRTCRATGRPLTPGAVMPAMRLERHHLKPRSTHPELITDSRNVVTVAADVHQLIEAAKIEVEGTDADGRLIFRWATGVPEKERIVTLLSKRKSQRRQRQETA